MFNDISDSEDSDIKDYTESNEINFTYIKKIGKGRYGKIYLILNNNNNEYNVVKHIQKKYSKNVQHEIKMLKKIQNKSNYLLNMINYYVVENKDIMILTDYIEKSMDLNDFIHKYNLSNIKYLSIVQELLIGLKHLHLLDLVHMDIKPKNILIYKDYQNGKKYYKIKYIDFGFACDKENKNYMSVYRGTAQYMDPYMIERKIDTFGKSKKADIWSLGITIYKLVHSQLPWENSEKEKIKQEITKIKSINSKNTFFSPIIENMLQRNLTKRYSLNKLIELSKNLQ